MSENKILFMGGVILCIAFALWLPTLELLNVIDMTTAPDIVITLLQTVVLVLAFWCFSKALGD